MILVLVLVQAALAALNATLYVADGHALSLGAAVFCGLGSIATAIVGVAEGS